MMKMASLMLTRYIQERKDGLKHLARLDLNILQEILGAKRKSLLLLH